MSLPLLMGPLVIIAVLSGMAAVDVSRSGITLAWLLACLVAFTGGAFVYGFFYKHFDSKLSNRYPLGYLSLAIVATVIATVAGYYGIYLVL